jgi:LAS superfamily LD-carboxypeptidase LdcB
VRTVDPAPELQPESDSDSLLPVLLHQRRHRRALVAVVVALFLVLSGVSATAQEGEQAKLDALKEEREALQADLAAKAEDVNIAEASAAEVIAALDAVNALVDLHSARLADADQAVRAAERLVAEAEARTQEIQDEIIAVQEKVSDLAVTAFTGEDAANGEDLTALLLNDDPTEAARRRSLVQFQTGSLTDSLDRVRALEAEAEAVEAERVRAVEDAENSRVEAQDSAVELQAAEDAQLRVVIDAETRLQARLSEATFLEEQDAGLAAEIRQQEEAIARRIREEAARKAAAAAAASRVNLPPPANRDDMENAEGFIVHRDVANDVGRMIRDARSDGVTLSGYGFRSPQRTAELRIINGCPDVYESSPSRCRIPTARPGESMHERGLAIDFSSCWRGSACFVWLSNNAGRYGFVNLPSESWHWSVNGR